MRIACGHYDIARALVVAGPQRMTIRGMKAHHYAVKVTLMKRSQSPAVERALHRFAGAAYENKFLSIRQLSARCCTPSNGQALLMQSPRKASYRPRYDARRRVLRRHRLLPSRCRRCPRLTAHLIRAAAVSHFGLFCCAARKRATGPPDFRRHDDGDGQSRKARDIGLSWAR